MASQARTHTADTAPPFMPKPLRFKRKRPSSQSDFAYSSKCHRISSPSPNRHRRHHRHRDHHHRSNHRRCTSTEAYPKDAAWDQDMHPDAAFRESLFDALADDEGAAFWEGVYGQPIHTYSPYFPTNNDPDKPNLERMTEDEYLTYVRAKMWEKSHGYVLEERRRREEERAGRKEKEKERKKWQANVEEALRRGEERRRKNTWKVVWDRYVQHWEGNFDRHQENGMVKKKSENIPWPVKSGRWEDVAKEEVEAFYRHAPQTTGGPDVDLLDVLKKERVRWHPDKMQQRAGSDGLDAETMKRVTAVFQVVDRLWGEVKGKS
ncbi:MAG: hypothetical protein Q9163_005228 [Psora crenata]